MQDLATATVTLGGKAFEIPPLSARQNRIVDPLILSVLPIFSAWQKDREAALSLLTQERYEALQQIAFVAITRAQPEWSKEAFLDLPITLPELIAALSVIARQTGLFEPSALQGDGGEGEGLGA